MDPNDYRNNGNESGQSPYTYRYGADQQPGSYYTSYNPYNPYGTPPNGRPPERKGLRRALIAIFMVLCLIVGSAFGVYLISPNLSGRDQSNVAVSTPAPTVLPEQDETAGAAEVSPDAALTTDNPQIGGEKPNISSGSSPVVEIFDKVGPSVVAVSVTGGVGTSLGTGIILSQDGYIVTNSHVINVEGRSGIQIQLYDGTEYKAGLVGADEMTDLAVLKIDATGLTAFAPGDSDNLRIGEEVVAIGNALGLGADTTTTGIISGLNKEVMNDDGYSQGYIQTDAAINPGNSGGPLINMSGQVIGINTIKRSYTFDEYGQEISIEGIGYAVPINTAIPVIEQLMEKGSVVRPGIGITCLVDEFNEYNPSGSPVGVTVVLVTEGGPADLAGLQANDIILEADGKTVETVEELTTIIKSHPVGDKISLAVWRSGTEIQAAVTIGDLNKIG